MIKNKTLAWILFSLMAAIQIAVPVWMIKQKTEIKNKGVAYKFELEAIDPNDPFRGKYIIISPKENKFKLPSSESLENKMFATFNVDESGFAKIKSLSKSKPDHSDYLEVKAYNYDPNYNSRSITATIIYPFDRYYMNEFKAKKTEVLIQSATQNNTSKCYAEISILNGKSNLTAVKLDGKAIEEILINQ